MQRFRPQNFKKFLANIRSQNQSIRSGGLMSLAEFLAYGDGESMTGFPLADFCKELVKIFQKDKSDEIIDIDTQCIVNILDCYPMAAKTLMSMSFLRIVRERLKALSVRSIENCIHAVSTMTKTRAKEIGQNLGIKKILRYIPSFRVAEQRFAIQAVSRITSSYVDERFVNSLAILAGLFTSGDSTVASEAITSFNNIIRESSLKDVPLCVAENVCVAIVCITDTGMLKRILEIILFLIESPELANAVIENSINFESIFRCSEIGPELDAIRHTGLIIMQRLLPQLT